QKAKPRKGHHAVDCQLDMYSYLSRILPAAHQPLAVLPAENATEPPPEGKEPSREKVVVHLRTKAERPRLRHRRHRRHF
ncbi:MAG: hypothetical protein ACK5L3_12035, partial [Oscillospiraceae bacterium]